MRSKTLLGRRYSELKAIAAVFKGRHLESVSDTEYRVIQILLRARLVEVDPKTKKVILCG